MMIMMMMERDKAAEENYMRVRERLNERGAKVLTESYRVQRSSTSTGGNRENTFA
jgi:hypothetical protein